MTYRLKYISIGLCMAMIFVTAFAMFYTVKANPSFFVRANGSGCTINATTSLAYITPGLATTTYYFDTGCAAAGSIDTATLLAQFTASSTLSTLNIAYEYAQGGGADCIATPTACDWYQNNEMSQSTSTNSVSNFQTNSWNFASSTQGQGAAINNNRQLKAIRVNTPTKYVRAIFSITPGALNGAVWAEFVGKRQNP